MEEKLYKLNEELRKIKIKISKTLADKNPNLTYPITMYTTPNSQLDNLINEKIRLETEIEEITKKLSI
jgi:chaperonin cofactor prefoldin